jgi:bifunctional non-homologous end joining protein LigD
MAAIRVPSPAPCYTPPVPPKITPIRPGEQKEPFNDPEWLFELKHDGFRAVAYLDRGRCRFVSRKGYAFPHWPALARWVAENLRAKSAILDGELVCLDEAGKSQFYDLMFRRKPPIYDAFDLLWIDGADRRDRPLLERKALLRSRLPAEPTQILYADHVEEHGVEFFKKVCELDLEGIVAKRKAAPYKASTKWIKIRNPAYSQKEGRREFFDSRRGGTR